MRTAGQPSWQIIVGNPQVLAIALYIRDLSGVVHEASRADLPAVVPPVARAEAGSPTSDATAEWNAWWSRALATGPGAVLELQPPAFPAFADAPALQQLLQEHFEAAHRWSERTSGGLTDQMRNSLPFGELVNDVGRALGRPVSPFTLRIDEVPVAGETWRPVTDAHVLVSPALLRRPVALFAKLLPAIQKLA